MSKKIFTIIIGLGLIAQISFLGIFNIPQTQASSYVFTETFLSTTHRDSANTTALWSVVNGNVTLPTEGIDQRYPCIDFTRDKELIIAWIEANLGYTYGNVYAQKLNSQDGDPIWNNDLKVGPKINSSAGAKNPIIVREPTIAGHTYMNVFWEDYSDHKLALQTVNQDGTFRLFEEQKLNTSFITGDISAVHFSHDFYTPSYMVWVDNRNTNGGDIYLQKTKFAATYPEFQWDPDVKVNTLYSGFQRQPDVAVDSNGNVYVVWNNTLRNDGTSVSSGKEILMQKFSSDGIPLWSSEIVISEEGQFPSIDVDLSSNTPSVYIAWQTVTSNGYDVFVQRFNLDGTPAWTGAHKIDTVNPTSWAGKTTPQPKVVANQESNRNGYPVFIAWYDAENDKINIQGYRQDVTGEIICQFGPGCTGTAYSAIEGPSAGDNSYVYFDFLQGFKETDRESFVYLVWSDKVDGDYDIFAQKFNIEMGTGSVWKKQVNDQDPVSSTTGIVQSTKINTITDTIIKATLTATDTQPINTTITYYLSVDGGSHWEEVISGAAHTFSHSGNDLRWKAELSTTNNAVTPKISQISISYATEIIEDTITATSPNGGESWKKGSTYSISYSYNTSYANPGFSIRLWKGNQMVKEIIETYVAPYGWLVPTDLEDGSDYKIEVRLHSCSHANACPDPIASDKSNGYFTIGTTTPPPTCFPDGTLIKLPTDPKIYVIINCKKKWIRTLDEFNLRGYKWKDVGEVSSDVLNAYADYLEAKANLLRAIGHNKVYRVVNGKRLWIPSIAAFNAQGLKWEDIEDKTETEINQYPRLKLTRAIGDPKVYYLTEGGLKRWIPTIEVFNSYNNKWEDVVEISATDLNTYPDSDLIRLSDGKKVYKLEAGKKRWIKTAQAFNRLGFDWNKIAPCNQTELNHYLEGAIIE